MKKTTNQLIMKTYNTEEFPVIALERDDILSNDALAEYGITGEDLDDDTMRYLARKISESCMQSFWEDLEHYVHRLSEEKKAK